MENKVAYLTQMDLATRWRVSRKTLEKWRWRGMGPQYLKLHNKTIRYSVSDIESYEASNLLKSTAEEYLKKSKTLR